MNYNRNFSIFGTDDYYKDYKDASDDKILYDYLDQLKGIDPRRAKMIRNELAKNPKAFDDVKEKIRKAKKEGGSARDIESAIQRRMRDIIDEKSGFWQRTREDNQKDFLDIAKTMLRNRHDFSEEQFSSVRQDKRDAYNAIDDLRGLSDDDPRRTTHRMDVLDSFVTDGVLSTIRDQIDDRRNRQLSKRADRLTARANAEEALSNARTRIENARHRATEASNQNARAEREHRSLTSIIEAPGDFIHELRMHRRQHQREIGEADRTEATARRAQEREERADTEHQQDRANEAADRAERVRHANAEAARIRTNHPGYEITVSHDGRRIIGQWIGPGRPRRGQQRHFVIEFSETPASKVVDKARDMYFNVMGTAATAMNWVKDPMGMATYTVKNKALSAAAKVPGALMKAGKWVDQKLGAAADKIGNSAPMRLIKKPFQGFYNKVMDSRGQGSFVDRIKNGYDNLKKTAYNAGKELGKAHEMRLSFRSGNNTLAQSWANKIGQKGNSTVSVQSPSQTLDQRVQQQRYNQGL